MTTETPKWLAGLEPVSEGMWRDRETGLEVRQLNGPLMQVRDRELACGVQFNCWGEVQCHIWTDEEPVFILADLMDRIKLWYRIAECAELTARIARAYNE